MITLYITRHGETVWNTEKRMQGWSDSKLTENGERNAESLGNRLKDTHFSAIYSSPSDRTKRTSDLIRGTRDIPIFYDNNLKEINMGEWEGNTLSSIKENYPSEFDAFWNTPHQFTPIGGEAFEEVKDRTVEFIDHIRKNHESGNVLAVSHSIVIKCMFSIFKNLNTEDIWAPPYIHDTSLSIVELDQSECKILLEGDVSHKEYMKS